MVTAVLAATIYMLVTGTILAQPVAPRMLVIDYAMAYPEENAGLMSVFSEAGYEVQYRQYYPALVSADASNYDAIVLMGGGDPGMSAQEVDFAINFVSRGKLLILAVPPDAEYGGSRRANPGAHDRYMFNRILNRLNINMYAYAPPVEQSIALTPVLTYEAADGQPAFQGIQSSLLARSDTRVLVGPGVLPLILAPQETNGDAESMAQNEVRRTRTVQRKVRVQPSDARPEEEIELLLRGSSALRPVLHYKSGRDPVPVAWSTEDVKGRVISTSVDTVTVRLPGNRWGSEYAIVQVPYSLTAATYVRREMTEEVEAQDGDEMLALTDTGRMAVVAVGRGDRLEKGFVVAADRRFLNALSISTSPISLPHMQLPDAQITAAYLTRTARFLRAMSEDPTEWDAEHAYEQARIPGLREPDFPTNSMEIIRRLPERVKVVTNATTVRSLLDEESPDILDEPARGIPARGIPARGAWDYLVRGTGQVDSLLSLMINEKFDFFWSVTPGSALTASDSSISESMRFDNWGGDISSRLEGTGVAWYTGITQPDEPSSAYSKSTDPRGNDVEMPSILDLEYWEKEIIAPSLKLAEFSLAAPELKGILHDWETHISRPHSRYAATDAFQDDPFRQFVRHLAHNGWYEGEEFDTFRDLGRKRRFEWLLKSGRLEMYFQFLEGRAEAIGRFYRAAIDRVNPGLVHGGFVRELRLSWFHLGFWRGMSDPAQPLMLLSYGRRPSWHRQFLARYQINERYVPVALLGLISADSYETVLAEAENEGGYVLERGIWLVSDPEDANDITSPRR